MLRVTIFTVALAFLFQSAPVTARFGSPGRARPNASPPRYEASQKPKVTDRPDYTPPRRTASAARETSLINACDYVQCSNTGITASTTRPTTTTPLNTAYTNCAIAWYTLAYYEYAYYPYWDYYDDDDMAQVLCYRDSPANSLVWAPNAFDTPWNDCLKWASTAAKSDQPYYEAVTSFCATKGNVLKASSTDTAVPFLASAEVTAAATTAGGKGGGSLTGTAGNPAKTGACSVLRLPSWFAAVYLTLICGVLSEFLM
ncbi:uncharacterized protein BDR25DRAFT_312676 [Lindgomyces ingoldianus]|uniref:Uncharacterized protein n=1 Tax=Lindgomyces ingoldianus TaxID=673940 RepID=A0ACB6R146_9PLEO|nr:uncharacterized protein BDR25DRAFT_312676 [Lindgomyces ingoldianus]KAF2472772.1 hypothetical protein BDR25DRAFT_312676 [Lindgomyces ingoldianus]